MFVKRAPWARRFRRNDCRFRRRIEPSPSAPNLRPHWLAGKTTSFYFAAGHKIGRVLKNFLSGPVWQLRALAFVHRNLQESPLLINQGTPFHFGSGVTIISRTKPCGPLKLVASRARLIRLDHGLR